MPVKQEHRCEKFPKGYLDLKIEFFKEAIAGWNWNLSVQDPEDNIMWCCYHIKHCPFCGINLDEMLETPFTSMECPKCIEEGKSIIIYKRVEDPYYHCATCGWSNSK